jgi:protein-tyrosine phosphatase
MTGRPAPSAPASAEPDGEADGSAAPVGHRLSVCFVCTGNICRSPMAAAVLGQLAEDHLLSDGSVLGHRLAISSAGTGGWHAGEPIDGRALFALERRGYTDRGHRARAFASAWFASTDLVVCLDRSHQQTLLGRARGRVGDDRYEERMVLLRTFDRRAGGHVDVPDPYYGDDTDFEHCLDLVEAGCRGLVPYLAGRLDQDEAKVTKERRS